MNVNLRAERWAGLTWPRYQQLDDIYMTLTTSNNTDYPTRPMTLGCAGYNNKQVTFWAYGVPYGLLQ
jgi:hypothetical protein